MGATYDLSTPLGQTRFRIPDTNPKKQMFSNDELDYLLDQKQNNPLLAAAEALDIVAGDPNRLLQFTRGNISGMKTASADLRKRAAELRSQASEGGIIVGTVERTDFW